MAVFVYSGDIRDTDIAVVAPHGIGEQFNAVRRYCIVAVEEENIFTRCFDESCIARRRETAVRFVNDLYSPIFFSPCIAHGGATVRRAVIDKDYLKVRIRLPNNAFDALIEIFFNFVNWDYYAYHSAFT